MSSCDGVLWFFTREIAYLFVFCSLYLIIQIYSNYSKQYNSIQPCKEFNLYNLRINIVINYFQMILLQIRVTILI